MVQEQIQRSMSKSSRQTREVARRLSKLTEVQAAVGWGLILLVIAVLGVIYLNQSSRIAAVGRHVQDLRLELDRIQRENTDIEREIAEAQSLSRLQKEAERMGFVRSESFYVDYIVIPPFTSIVSDPQNRQAQDRLSAQPIESIQEALLFAVESTINNLMEGESGG